MTGSIRDLLHIRTHRTRQTAQIIGFAAVLASSACTYVPFDVPRAEAPGVEVASSGVYQMAQARTAHLGGQSLFVPLVEGNDALGARLDMIEAAQRSIDIQTFLIKPDYAGGLISLALLKAADKGVRVRVLTDDVFTTAKDGQLALLDSHPNIYVRRFNPLTRRSPKALAYLYDFDRVNRRMHNKIFVVDDAAAIVGGRNIADEYYQIDVSSEFADFDLFVSGPAVLDLRKAFDVFWNDRWSVSVANLTSERTSEEISFESVRMELDGRASQAAEEIYQRAVTSQYIADVQAQRVPIYEGPTYVVSDLPTKLKVPVQDGERPLAQRLLGEISRAKSNVLIVTPYFVPEDWGRDLFLDLAQRGVRVRIVTNSLASNNHAYVHAGYRRHRETLLAAGVELYEVRADAPKILSNNPDAANVTMHTKLFIVDDSLLVLSSMNFDPRSIKLNSEIGLFVEDADVARLMRDSRNEQLGKLTYRLSLDQNGKLLWIYDNGVIREVETSEPGATGMQKFIAGATELLPVEGQL